jgi:hypothetical protein
VPVTNLTEPRSSAAAPDPGTPLRPARALDGARAEDCLQLLARAVQQLHTYPVTSPLCESAIAAAHKAFAGLDQRDHLDFRVTPHDVVLDETPVGRGTIVETELARRLHGAAVAQVTIERAASSRELMRFCIDLIACGERRPHDTSLGDMLAEHGVSRIALRRAYRPEILGVAPPPPPVALVIGEQQARRDALLAQGGSVNHLYPPDKGWVRIDPAAPFSSVSLGELALLVDHPTSLATMRLRQTDDDMEGTRSPQDALAHKFSEVATLFGALDPRVARVMFSRLARAVLELEPERRQMLLRRTILPGLLDGRMEGEVLKDFPDLDLADSLCLLLDLETAAPEVVTTALSRLGLPAERQEAMLPLIRERLEARAGRARESTIDAHARKLIAVDTTKGRTFEEFAAFDLALDEHAAGMLVRIRQEVEAMDVSSNQLACVWNLVRLEANPEVVQRFVLRVIPGLEQLEADGRWPYFAFWLAKFGELAAGLREARPDVSDAIDGMLRGLSTVERANRIVELASSGVEGRAAADTIIIAMGAGIGPALAEAARARGSEAREANARVAQQLLSEHAVLVGPAVADALPGADPVTARALVRVLGNAGPGYETPIALQLRSDDEQTVREALRSLARIATPRAAACVRAGIDQPRAWLSLAAAETLWRFPPADARREVLELLSDVEFVRRQPAMASRLLERAAQTGSQDLQPVLTTLVPLRYRLWSPALARVGRRAHALLAAAS